MTSNNLLLEVMFGEEIFDNANAKVSLFAVPSALFNSFDRELFIDIAARKSDIPVSRHSIEQPVSPYAEVYRDDLGKWTRGVYTMPEGMIMKIFALRHSGFGQRRNMANQFIRMRANAAYREVKIALTQHTKARFSYAIIKGRFDLITPDQATKRGVKSVSPNFLQFFSPTEVARCMTFSVIEDEREPVTVVRERVSKRANGERAVVQTVRKARALDLD